MNQVRMFYESHRRVADLNELLMEMITSGEITNEELAELIKRRPDKYERFAGFVGTLKEPK